MILSSCHSSPGSFSLSEMHSWVGQTLNDVPPTHGSLDTCSYRYQNSLLGTLLTVK